MKYDNTTGLRKLLLMFEIIYIIAIYNRFSLALMAFSFNDLTFVVD